jgi:hypothetical protein
MQSTADKGFFDSVFINTEFFSNLPKTKPLRSHGFCDLKVPGQMFMLAAVHAAIHDDKIFKVVIQLIPVFVVNDLVGHQLAPKRGFHDKAMLTDRLVFDTVDSIPIGSDIANAHVCAMAGMRAEVAPAASDCIERSVDRGTALGTGGRGTQAPLTSTRASNAAEVEPIGIDFGQAPVKRGAALSTLNFRHDYLPTGSCARRGRVLEHPLHAANFNPRPLLLAVNRVSV